MIKQALKFKFKDSNNQVEYKAHIDGMVLTLEMGVHQSSRHGVLGKKNSKNISAR